jgi:O-antigen/teichoic acid export membrane protein
VLDGGRVEAGGPPAGVPPAAAAVPALGESLTARASRTFRGNLLQHGARVLVALAVTPLLIRGLGAERYGAWVMVQQTVGYLALGDLRPMGTLKITLAVQQHLHEVSRKRRQVGAALLTWLLSAPVLALLGGVLVWAAPLLVRTAPEHVGAVRAAMAITAGALILEALWSLPANVLRGMNLEYRAMGVQALVVLVTGAGTALAVLAGWGLAGVALTTVAGAAVGAAVRWPIMRRAVPWFGVERPRREELRQFVGLSAWSFAGALAYVVLMGSDFLLAGMVASTASVAMYAATGAVLRMAAEPLAQLLGSGNAGIHGLAGAGAVQRVQALRREMLSLALAGMTVLGAGVIVLNESFLRLWVGEGFYAGSLVNVLLVVISIQAVLFRVESSFTDSFLVLREKAIAMGAAGVLSIALAALLGLRMGLAGVALGMVLGRLGLTWYMPHVVRRRTGAAAGAPVLRVAAASAAVLALAVAAAPLVQPRSWPGLVLWGAAVVAASGGAMLAVGLGGEARARMLSRVRAFAGR